MRVWVRERVLKIRLPLGLSRSYRLSRISLTLPRSQEPPISEIREIQISRLQGLSANLILKAGRKSSGSQSALQDVYRCGK